VKTLDWAILDPGSQHDPYPELAYLAAPDVYFCSHYHGLVKNYNNQPVVIYSCFGEAEPSPNLESVLNKFKNSFTIILTHRNYPQSLEQKFNCKIVKIKYAYAYYSRKMKKQSLYQCSVPTKKFLSLNNRASWDRQALMQYLVKYDLMKDFYFSYWCEDRFGVGKKVVYDQMSSIIGNTWFNRSLDLEKLYQLIPITIEHDQFEGNDWSAGTDFFYQTSFASFVNESYVHETTNIGPYLSEKVMKPLAYGHPFLVFGSAGSLANLQELGFETFGDVIDETYDNEPDDVQRWSRAFEQVQWLCKQNLPALLKKLQPRLEHNHHRLYEFEKEKNQQLQNFVQDHLK
jgi:hypothetical protein